MRLLRLALAALPLLASACRPSAPPPAPADEPPARTPHAPRPAEAAPRSAPSAAVDEAVPEPAAVPDPWPPSVEPLADSLDDLADCERRLRERVPLELAEAIADLGYDRMILDVCESLRAAEEGDPARCETLAVSALRRSCLRRLAVARGEPEHCPTDPGSEVRDPVCVAWASRNAGLCHAATGDDAIRCDAAFRAAPAACAGVRPELGARCRADVARYGALLRDARDTHALEVIDPRAEVRLRGRAAGADAAPLAFPFYPHGVRAVADGCAHRIDFAPSNGERAALDPGVAATAELRFAVRVPIDARGARRRALPLASALRLRVPPASWIEGTRGEVALDSFSPARGARVEATVTGTVHAPEGPLHVTARVRTFLRDVDPLPAACAAAL